MATRHALRDMSQYRPCASSLLAQGGSCSRFRSPRAVDAPPIGMTEWRDHRYCAAAGGQRAVVQRALGAADRQRGTGGSAAGGLEKGDRRLGDGWPRYGWRGNRWPRHGRHIARRPGNVWRRYRALIHRWSLERAALKQVAPTAGVRRVMLDPANADLDACATSADCALTERQLFAKLASPFNRPTSQPCVGRGRPPTTSPWGARPSTAYDCPTPTQRGRTRRYFYPAVRRGPVHGARRPPAAFSPSAADAVDCEHPLWRRLLRLLQRRKRSHSLCVSTRTSIRALRRPPRGIHPPDDPCQCEVPDRVAADCLAGRCTVAGEPACDPDGNANCNHEATMSWALGTCNPDGTCTCVAQATIHPETGRCDLIQ